MAHNYRTLLPAGYSAKNNRCSYWDYNNKSEGLGGVNTHKLGWWRSAVVRTLVMAGELCPVQLLAERMAGPALSQQLDRRPLCKMQVKVCDPYLSASSATCYNEGAI